ncbi:MAG: hypothetical protein MJE66_08055 [Proteobacteria bacterium]|nr:hypothetical protein [Pseudomonadota bacterium]
MAKAKGTTMVSFAKFLGSRRADAEPLLPPELHPYLDGRLMDSGWYPESELLALIQASLRLLPGTRAETLEAFGRTAAREHLEGLYSHLRGESDPWGLPRRVFALWSSQHDTGKMRMQVADGGEGVLFLEGYEASSPEICGILKGYLLQVLEAAELTDPAVAKATCCVEGDEVCSWSFTWRVA